MQRDHPRHGLYLYSFASRQRTYGDWLVYEELKPHRDPDEPELLGELEEIVDNLSRKAAVAVASCTSGEDRDEIMGAVFDENPFTPRTRFGKAKVRIAMIRAIATWGVPGAEAAGQRLAEQKEKLQAHASEGELDQLGLGPVAPDMPLQTLRRMQSFLLAGEA